MGIYGGQWVASTGARVHVAVVDQQGKPAAGAPVRLLLFSHKTYSYRKRLVGGFYAYENTVETRSAGELCSGRSDQRGQFVCNAKPALTGNVLVQASVTDDGGNTSAANTGNVYPRRSARMVRGA